MILLKMDQLDDEMFRTINNSSC